MKRTVLLVAIFASAALFVPTGANPQFEEHTTDGVSEDIVMWPSDGPNGNYAAHNEDGDIELFIGGMNSDLDGDGVNPDTVMPIKRIFTITYTGEGSARVWITDDAGDVRFFHGDDVENSIEGSDDSVVLDANETVAVGIVVDTTGPDHDVEEANTFTVHATVDDNESPLETTRSFDNHTTESDQETIQDTLTESTASTPNSTPHTPQGHGETTAESRASRTEIDLETENHATAPTRSAQGNTEPSDRITGKSNAESDTTRSPVGFPIGSLLLILGLLAGAKAWVQT